MENRTVEKIILASGSKYRQQILNATGLEFDVIVPRVNEYEILGASGREVAIARANAKADSVAMHIKQDSLVIVTDQTLSLEGQLFDKAQSEAEAFERLTTFSGKTHYLHSAVSVFFISDSQETYQVGGFCKDIPMKMKTLSEQTIKRYLGSGEWRGCVGCYQAENMGSALFNKIGGDSTSVIGLPICELTRLLEGLNINIIENPTGPWMVAL